MLKKILLGTRRGRGGRLFCMFKFYIIAKQASFFCLLFFQRLSGVMKVS
uniref:Uncharacterized protein n=1 Tax=Anguilla anguilla TaxID=7936 RepID=A0A0E9XNI3_ANGAN